MSYITYYCICVFLVFFFKQKTAYEMRISDWSSDVCSSDLLAEELLPRLRNPPLASAHIVGEEVLTDRLVIGDRLIATQLLGDFRRSRRAVDGDDIDRKSTRLNSSH